MKACDFELANQYMGEPKNWDSDANGTVGKLPVHYDGKVSTSVWQPTEEELELLNKGGSVVLGIFGWQPCVSLNVRELDVKPIFGVLNQTNLDLPLQTYAVHTHKVKCNLCDDSGWMYGDPDLGHCTCEKGQYEQHLQDKGDAMAGLAEDAQKEAPAAEQPEPSVNNADESARHGPDDCDSN